MPEKVVHLKWNEQQNTYIDCGVADKIGVGTIVSADVDVFECRECKQEFDANWHESYRVEEDA